MTRQARAELKSRLADSGVRLTGLASYVTVAADTADDVVVGALVAALQLAADLGAPMIRVFPSAPMASVNGTLVLAAPVEVVDERAARRLNAVSHSARDLGVFPVLETHDSHPRGEDVARILKRVEAPVGVVWDLLHPIRAGESIDATWKFLSPWLAGGHGSVQIKDATLHDLMPTLIGEGDLPVDAFAELLIREGYDGTVSLEWEKAWNPSIPTLEKGLDSAQRWFRRHWPE
jgi:sugar phosphate isomerase/epimerase